MAIIHKDIDKAVAHLRSEEIVAVPTETVYGLAGNALSKKALEKIFVAKQRPKYDPLIIHLFDKEQLDKYCRDIPEIFELLFDNFCPGPLSFLLFKKEIISDLLTAGSQKVAVRFPSQGLFRSILEKVDFPIAAPSANPFGYISPTNPDHVNDQLGNKIDMIVDGGECKVGIESTIIDITEKKPRILRQGSVTKSQIETVLGIEVAVNHSSSSKPDAPGMLSSHYAPIKKVSCKNVDTLLHSYAKDQIFSLRYKETTPLLDDDHQLLLSQEGNLQEVAFHLFDYLRKADKQKISVIHIDKIPKTGIGAAINDKIKRASA